MLLEMSIHGSITIKIDEHKGELSILYSELRNIALGTKDDLYMGAKIKEIAEKNEKVIKKKQVVEVLSNTKT